MLTMLLGGLWHGASWTFVVWGGIHGTGLAVEHAGDARRKRRGLPALNPHGAAPLGGAIHHLPDRLHRLGVLPVDVVLERLGDVREHDPELGHGLAAGDLRRVLAATIVGIGVQYVPRVYLERLTETFGRLHPVVMGLDHRGVPDRHLQSGAGRRRPVHLLLVLGDVRHPATQKTRRETDCVRRLRAARRPRGGGDVRGAAGRPDPECPGTDGDRPPAPLRQHQPQRLDHAVAAGQRRYRRAVSELTPRGPAMGAWAPLAGNHRRPIRERPQR